MKMPPPVCDCGCSDVMAVSPGTEPEEFLGMVLDAGERTRAWCRSCWLRRFRRMDAPDEARTNFGGSFHA